MVFVDCPRHDGPRLAHHLGLQAAHLAHRPRAHRHDCFHLRVGKGKNVGIRHDFKIEIMQLIQTKMIIVMEFHSEVGIIYCFFASKRLFEIL